MTEKVDYSFDEDVSESNNIAVDEVSRTRTIDVDNYHGLTVKIVVVYLAICFIGLAQLMMLVAAGAFGRDIALVIGGLTETVWLIQPIVIVTVVLAPIISQASDFWGRKWFLVITTGIGVVGLIVVSRANSIGMAIVGQCIIGIVYGSQGLLYAVASEIVPRRFRPAAQGGLNSALALGGIVALLGGEAMIRDFPEGFRIFYYFSAALLALSTLILAVLYNPPLRPLQQTLTLQEKLNRLDWIGYILLTFGIVLFSVALSWAENPYPWTSAQVLAPFFIGVAFLVALAIHQTKFKRDGLFHHGLFKHDRNFAIALFIILLDGMAFASANTYFAFEISLLFETDPVRVGLRYSIVFFAAIASAFAVSGYSSYRKTVRAPIVLSFLLVTVFCALMATVQTSSSTAVWCYVMLLGIGIGISLTCLVTAAQMSAPPELIATSSGLMIASRSVGGSIALAIYTAELSSGLSKNLGADIANAVLPLGLKPDVLPAFIGALAGNNPAVLAQLPGVTPEIIGAGFQGLLQGYLASFRIIWITAAVLSFVAALAGCFLKDTKKDFTMHVDAPLDENN